MLPQNKTKNIKAQIVITSVIFEFSYIKYFIALKLYPLFLPQHLLSKQGFLKISQDLAGPILAGQELKLK